MTYSLKRFPMALDPNADTERKAERYGLAPVDANAAESKRGRHVEEVVGALDKARALLEDMEMALNPADATNVYVTYHEAACDVVKIIAQLRRTDELADVSNSSSSR